MKKNTNKKGLTLVEMVLVIAIIVMFTGITCTVSAVKLHDYQLKTQIYLKDHAGFESASFETMNHLHDYEKPPITSEAVANDLANNTEVAGQIGNIENFNSMQANVNGKEAALMSAISDAIGTDDFFCEVYHDTKTNTKTLYIYVGDMEAVRNSDSVKVAVISYAQQHGEMLWAATGDVQFVQAKRNESHGFVVQNHTVNNLTYTNTADSTTGTTTVVPTVPTVAPTRPTTPQFVAPTVAPTNTPVPTVAPTNTPAPTATPVPTNTPVPTAAPTTAPTTSSDAVTVSTTAGLSTSTWTGGGQIRLPKPQHYNNYSQIVYVIEVSGTNVTHSGGWNYTNCEVNGNTITITIDNPTTNEFGVQFNGDFTGARIVSVTGTLK